MKKNKKKNNTPKKNNGIKIYPTGNRVLIRPFSKEEIEKKSNFGIILPSEGLDEKSEQGVIMAVGPGEYRDGKLISVSLNVGDKVAFSKYGFEEIKMDGEEYYLIKEENILAVIK